MDSSHGAAAGGGGMFGAALAAVLASIFHWDVSLAANWVVVITTAAGAAGALAVWFVKWRWPSAPPLPGELVEIPPGAAPVQVARVQAPAVVPAAPLPPAVPAGPLIVPAVPGAPIP